MNGIGFSTLGNVAGVQNRPAVNNKPAAVVETPQQPQGESFQFQGGALLQTPVALPVEVPVEKAPTPEAAPQQTAAPAQPAEFKYQGSTIQTTNTGALVQFDSGLSSVGLENEHPEFQAMAWGMDMGFLREAKTITSITSKDVDWDKGAAVVSNAQKFVIPVPQFVGGGEALIYPDGAKDKDGNNIAGKPILDWENKPIGDQGVVFFNQKDQAWQAVKADGNGVVIMNQMTEAQGAKLMEKIGGDPSNLSLAQFKEVLSYASSEDVGCKDMYNSDRAFISKKMNAMEASETGVPQFGMFRRDDKDVCKALFVSGPADFAADSSGGVLVHQPIGEEGAVILRQPGSPDRKIDNQSFIETYLNKNGTKISIDSLPRAEV
jgi:hypothetical protein